MSSAFRLSVDDGGLATLVFDLSDHKVNVFNRASIEELEGLVAELGQRSDIRCLVLASGKARNFIAGADIEEIAGVTDPAIAEEGSRRGQEVFSAWEALPFPTVAAVRGTCVGGGCEISLASDYIVLSDRDDVRIGLPEIKLGILPGWGGCVRLPKKVGLAAALDVILAGKTLRPYKAFKIGLADALVPDASFEREVRAFAERIIAGKKPGERGGDLKQLLLEKNPLGRKVIWDQSRKQVLKSTKGKYPAPLRAIEVVRTGIERGAKAGFEAEARAIGELAVSRVSKNLVHLFQMMEASKRGGTATPDGAREIRRVGVLGAGIMGGGIGQIVADKTDLPVRIKDIGSEQLASAMEHASGLFFKQVKRRWLSKPEAARKMALLRPTLEYTGFESIDLVVEAVVEILDVKRKVFADLEERLPADAILASNTSSLSIDLLAEGTRHPERIVGMHFFNPVDKMPLVEIIRGSATADHVVESLAAFTRRLGKTPVVVGDGTGFLVNRILAFTMAEAMWLLDDGVPMAELDRAATDWGLPMGPLTLIDVSGIDVAVKVGHIVSEAFPDRLSFPDWFDRMVEDGRLGAKSQRGFYTYRDGRRQQPDEKVYALLGLEPKAGSLDATRISERLILPMVNEAARTLADGIAARAADVDLAMIMGTGFPPFHGGLCRWADQQGVASLDDRMRRLAESVGERHAPSPAFEEVVAAGGFYSRYA